MKTGDKKGSALLIVLGMFAFMLVSAVAFSMYMRASRAPSSYLRRNASTRQVVKAAVARAIDEIDSAIGNDPFPGVGYNHDSGSTGTIQGNRRKNDNWHGRVFTPSNEVALADTVSTLTLEALGYLPPSIVNEVRYWSRHTRTAKWHTLNYGLGRYAFTAVNVSDFFDLSILGPDSSGRRRQYLNRSSAPHGRVSPAYLFRSSRNGDMDTGGAAAQAFLSAISGGAGVGGGSYPALSDVPFISMMDFNLAVGAKGGSLGGLASPFINLIKNNNNNTFLSGTEDAARRTLFMAGGWNADSNLTYQAYSGAYGGNRVNLRYPEFQPFDGCSSWFPEQTTLTHCNNDISADHPFWKPYNNNFPIIAQCMLCDYLDYDNVPLSLCLPCTEAVPMLCGVEVEPGVKYTLRYVKGTPAPNGTPTASGFQPLQRIDECWVDVDIDINPIITAVYPFINEQPGQSSSFEVECYVRVFFQEESGTGDGNLNDGGLRNNDMFDLGSNLDSGWSTLVQNPNGKEFIALRGSLGSISLPKFGSGNVDEKAAIIGNLTRRMQCSRPIKLADLIFQDNSGGGFSFDHAEDANQIDFYPKNSLSSGSRVNFATTFTPSSGTAAKYHPNVAIWVRIKDGSKTVDMAPAIPAYDNMNGFADNKNEAVLPFFNTAAGGAAGAPAFRFFPKVTGVGIQPDQSIFNDGGIANGQSRNIATYSQDWKQRSYLANDPRINWAPEQWWATDLTDDPKDLWLNRVINFRSADTSRDSDIFMSASNQGYLQSMYEWMFIPQVRELFTEGNGGVNWGIFENGNGYDGVVRTAIGDVLHRDVMWRTYRSDAFAPNSTWGSIDSLAFDDADNGLRVNPYTDMMELMLGAFANMPRDWWAASTNHLANGKSYMDPNGPSFEDSYLFDWSCKYGDVYNMAYYWYGAFRRMDISDEEERGRHLYMSDAWKDAFEDAVNWRTGVLNYGIPIETGAAAIDTGVLQEGRAGAILQELTSAERKFLYGYLKGCFANNSQLFLIFVRAETSAGGAVGAGARAVALVWRDPSAPMDASGQFRKADGGTETPEYGKDNGGMYLYAPGSRPDESWRFNEREYPPHKTRILFYHQFD